jgi:hypothetical protein
MEMDDELCPFSCDGRGTAHSLRAFFNESLLIVAAFVLRQSFAVALAPAGIYRRQREFGRTLPS